MRRVATYIGTHTYTYTCMAVRTHEKQREREGLFLKVGADVSHTSCRKGPRLCLSAVVKRRVRMRT